MLKKQLLYFVYLICFCLAFAGGAILISSNLNYNNQIQNETNAEKHQNYYYFTAYYSTDGSNNYNKGKFTGEDGTQISAGSITVSINYTGSNFMGTADWSSGASSSSVEAGGNAYVWGKREGGIWVFGGTYSTNYEYSATLTVNNGFECYIK